MRAEHDMTAATASAPPRLRRVLLCLLLALAMLVSFCLPSFDAIGLGVQSAWAEELDDEGGESSKPDFDDAVTDKGGLATATSETDLKAVRNKTLTVASSTLTKIKGYSASRWFKRGWTYIYLVNDVDTGSKGVVITPGTTTYNFDNTFKVKCAGWAQYRLDFKINGSDGSFTDTSGAAATYKGVKLDTNKACAEFDETSHKIDVQLTEMNRVGEIGTLSLSENDSHIYTTFEVQGGYDDRTVMPVHLTYTMPTGDQNIRYYYRCVGDSSAKAYSQYKCTHRLWMAEDIGGGTRGLFGNSILNLNQKNAESSKKTADIYVSVNAKSCGLRTANVVDKTTRKVISRTRNTGTWQMAMTAKTTEKVQLDLDGGKITGLASDAGVLADGGYAYTNGTKLKVPNPTKAGYVFAGWKWVKTASAGKTAYKPQTGADKYADPAPAGTAMNSREAADKYAQDNSGIEGRVYDSSSSASTSVSGAAAANAATKESIITVNNGFIGEDYGPANCSKGVSHFTANNHYIGTATTKYKAMWVTTGLTLTYHVGKEKNGAISDWNVVKQYVDLKAGTSLSSMRPSASSFNAKGWYTSKKCTTKATIPATMPNRNLNYYGYVEEPVPDGDEALINYYVDGELSTTYTITFDEQWGTADGSNIGQVGVRQYGRTTFPDSSVRKFNNDLQWNANTFKLTGTYQQATDTRPDCNHTTGCSHSYPCWCDEYGCSTCYSHYQDYVHDGGGSPGKDTQYEYTSTQNVKSGAVSGSAPTNLGHTDSVCGNDKWYKWYLKDPDCSGSTATTFAVKRGKVYNLYSFTLHKVTYTVNPKAGYTGTTTKDYQKDYTHWEKWDSVEKPADVTEDNPECESMHTGTGNSPAGKMFKPSELPEPRLAFYGWYTDAACENEASEVQVGTAPQADSSSHLHFYSYTTHEVRWVSNPAGEPEEVLSEEVRLGQTCEDLSETAKAAIEASLDDRGKAYFWNVSYDGTAKDWDRNSPSDTSGPATGKEGAEPNMVFSSITYHEGHFIMDESTDATKDWKYSDLVSGAEDFPMKQGKTYPAPTGSYTSGKVTLSGCEDWATHATEDGLVPNQWFESPYYGANNTVVGGTDDTRYSYNTNYLTLDFTTYAKSLDKDMEGKYQLFSEKVEKKTENSATKLKVNGIPGLRGYLEYTDYEKCSNCSHTEHSALYQGGSQQIANHHFYKYGDSASIPQLRPCYWLNDSKLNNTGYNEGDQLLSRNARNPEGGAYLTPGAKRNQMVGTEYTVRGNTVLYMDYVQGLYDGVITG